MSPGINTLSQNLNVRDLLQGRSQRRCARGCTGDPQHPTPQIEVSLCVRETPYRVPQQRGSVGVGDTGGCTRWLYRFDKTGEHVDPGTDMSGTYHDAIAEFAVERDRMGMQIEDLMTDIVEKIASDDALEEEVIRR